mmetsp:Transcript_23919/g.54506  ORF Transcript_23919/g.54506 Transcript_23919/m.54506 type:complete len:124 (-) Transcript_23919:170-541(-)
MILRDVLEGTSRVVWVSHLSPMASSAQHTRQTMQFVRSLREVARDVPGKRPPVRWNRSEVQHWVKGLEDGKYAHLARWMEWADGATIKHEWRVDFVQRLSASGVAEDEAEFIFDAFHELLKAK